MVVASFSTVPRNSKDLGISSRTIDTGDKASTGGSRVSRVDRGTVPVDQESIGGGTGSRRTDIRFKKK